MMMITYIHTIDRQRGKKTQPANKKKTIKTRTGVGTWGWWLSAYHENELLIYSLLTVTNVHSHREIIRIDPNIIIVSLWWSSSCFAKGKRVNVFSRGALSSVVVLLRRDIIKLGT